MDALLTYWDKHPNLEFGAMLDSLLSSYGFKKDLSFYTSTDFLEWIEEDLCKPDTITSEELQKLRVKALKEYYEKPSNFGEEPKSLFIDGEFSKSNYFGGDDIIRYFFNEVYEEGIILEDAQLELGDATVVANIEASFNCNDMDDTYTFIIMISGMFLEAKVDFFDVAVFKISTDGQERISHATLNNHEITEEEYLFVLNVIKKSGFDFDKGCYPSRYDSI